MTKYQKGKENRLRNRSSIVETLGLSDRDFMITIIGKGEILHSLKTEYVLSV